ncbi:hypothetical protein G7054_g4998 [Neopestalotiopsis clavispora]|nr:hypothetical protein G7054_g4998 [Neopestalotiopsis clavispora]
MIDRSHVSPRLSPSSSNSPTDLETPDSGDDSSSDILAKEEEIPGHLVPVFLQDLLQTFFCDHSTVNNYSVDQEGQEQCAPEKQSHTERSNSAEFPTLQNQEASNSHKRKRINGSDEKPGDGDGDDGDDDHRRQKVTLPKDPSANVLWACPFSKWKPLSYQSCHKYMMNDISRVKQHLTRKHQKPFCCPTCSDVFHELDEFYEHIAKRTCTRRPRIELEGITPPQRKILERRSDKRQSKQEQWYTIYSVIFPEAPRPATPYVDGNLSAELLSFQRFMSQEGPGIIEQTAKAHIAESLLPHQDDVLSFAQTLFQHAIPAVLQRYEHTRPNNNSPNSGHASSSSETPVRAAKAQHEAIAMNDIGQNITTAQATDVGPQQLSLYPERTSNPRLNNMPESGDLHEAQLDTRIDTDLLQDLIVAPNPSIGEELTWDPDMPLGTDALEMTDLNLPMEWIELFPMRNSNGGDDAGGIMEPSNDIPQM